jgi:hypothetical protein
MKKNMMYLILVSIALMSTTMAQDFVQGEAKGADSASAMAIGQDGQDKEANALFRGESIQLSGIGGDIFDTAFFQSDGWVFDATGYSLTPSMAAFLKDSPADGKPLTPAKKAAFVGSQSNPDDPRL